MRRFEPDRAREIAKRMRRNLVVSAKALQAARVAQLVERRSFTRVDGASENDSYEKLRTIFRRRAAPPALLA